MNRQVRTDKYSNQPRHGNRLRDRLAGLGDRVPLLRSLWLAGLAGAGDLALLGVPAFALLNTAGFFWMLSAASSPASWLLVEIFGAQAALGLLLGAHQLLTRPVPPAGVEVSRDRAPLLFELVERRLAEYHLPRVDHIRLTTGAELRWVETPRRILPGASRHTLCIGLPLLFFLSDKQFHALLRSTLAQWDWRQHPLDTWIRRRAACWAQFSRACETPARLPGAALLARPVQSFARLLGEQAAETVDSLDLVRDNHTREVLDDEQLLALLAAETVCAAYLDQRFWPMIDAAAERTPEPVLKPFSNFGVFLERMLCREEADRWLLRALAQSASRARQHCGLRHRLEVLGYNQLRWPGLPGQAAFHALFGEQGRTTARELDRFWQDQVREEWRDRYQSFRAEQSRFRRLHEAAARAPLTGARARDYVKLAPRFLASEEALQALRTAWLNNQGDPALCFECGRRLLAAGDEQGVAAVETAMQIDQAWANEGAALISEFERRYRAGARTRKLYAVGQTA
ncbi:MAG TPA: hypothetical protein ENK12_09250 [Gammaproteobacteria bacterium]|nr:hypothetical protein [Gammaproteobacteria bacterium]